MTIRAVVFDIGGVLEITSQKGEECGSIDSSSRAGS
jgi:hypothetical protein